MGFGLKAATRLSSVFDMDSLPHGNARKHGETCFIELGLRCCPTGLFDGSLDALVVICGRLEGVMHNSVLDFSSRSTCPSCSGRGIPRRRWQQRGLTAHNWSWSVVDAARTLIAEA